MNSNNNVFKFHFVGYYVEEAAYQQNPDGSHIHLGNAIYICEECQKYVDGIWLSDVAGSGGLGENPQVEIPEQYLSWFKTSN